MEYTLLEKKVKFFRIKITKSGQTDMLTNYKYSNIETFNKNLTRFILDKNEKIDDYIKFNIDKNETYINFYSIDEKYIFGSIGKISSVRNKPLTEVMTIKESDYRSLTSEELEKMFVKDFSYFAIDLNNHNCVELVNGNAPGFKKHFPIFLRKNAKPVFNARYDIYPIKDEKLSNKMKRFKKLTDVSITMVDLEENDEILSIKDEFNLSNDQPTRVNLKIKYKNTPIDYKSFQTKIENIKSKDNVKKCKLTFQNEYNESETIEIIENLLIKQTSIELNQEDLTQESINENIKKALIKELSLLI